jgi:hypothetical protein
MALFGSDDEKPAKITTPVDPNWVRTPEGRFLPFLELDPEELGLNKVGGVFLIWHGGVRPQWVYAGHAKDLASAFHQAGNNKDITYYDNNGGLFVAWALVKEPYRAGVVKYLDQSFKTLVENTTDFNDKTEPIPVLPPSAKKRSAL